MASIYQLKISFQDLLRPVVTVLYRYRVTANHVTVFAALGSLLVAALISLLTLVQGHYWWFLLLPIWMFLRMALNAMDGMLAREFNQQSHLGAYLNELCDVISDSALYLSFLVLPEVSVVLLALIIFFAVISEYAGVMAPLVGVARRYDGPMGKSDRAALFGLLSIVVVIAPSLETWGWQFDKVWQGINGLLLLCLLLLLRTIYNRVHHGIHNASNAEYLKMDNSKNE